MDAHNPTYRPEQSSTLGWHLNCKGPQTNTPQNVGSIEDLITKNIQSRHIEFCKADRASAVNGYSPVFRRRVIVLQS